MICQRCAKERNGIHTCTPSQLVRELEQQRDSYKDVAEAHSSAFQECIRLREELAEVKQQLAGMTDSARHFADGMEYYRGLIDEAAKSIGVAMYTADDKGVHPDPLRAKLPECAAELVQQRDELLAALQWYADRYSNENGKPTVAQKAIAKVKP